MTTAGDALPPAGPVRAAGGQVRWVRARRWISVGLVVVASLLTTASVIAVWADRTAFAPERFAAVVTPTLQEPEFYAALSANVTEQTLEVLDLETRVDARLTQLDALLAETVVNAVDLDPRLSRLLTGVDRPTLAALAPGIVDALEERVETAVDRVLTSEQFGDTLVVLVGRAHRAAVALARGDAEDFPNVYLTEDELRLDTVPIITEVLRAALADLRDWLPDVTLPDAVSERLPEAREQLATALGERIPDDVGQVTLMSRDRFDEIRQTVARLDRFVGLTLALTLLVVVTAIAVAPVRRRAVIQLGLGIVATMVLTGAVVRRAAQQLAEGARTPEGEHVVRTLVGDVTASLRSSMLLVGLLAGGAALVFYLAGRPPWLRSAVQRTPGLRRLDAIPTVRWVARYADGLTVAVLALAVAIAALSGLSGSGIVLAVVVAAAGLWAVASARTYATTHQASPVGPAGPQA